MKKNETFKKTAEKMRDIFNKNPDMFNVFGNGRFMEAIGKEISRRNQIYAIDKFLSRDPNYREEMKELNEEYSKKCAEIRNKYVREYSKKGIDATEEGIKIIKNSRIR